MRTIFIGGPGRSGTSFVADRLARHPEVAAFRDVELKIFTEKNGLLDLWHSLVERYSPNRASVARLQFMTTARALISGQYGQPGFRTLAPEAEWEKVFATFLANISPAGQFERPTADNVRAACQQLLKEIAHLSIAAGRKSQVFVEKTPHGLLALDFLTDIAPGAGFVHVMRDPRSIAQSLRTMRWGPDDLDDCCAWVSGYCSAWVEAQNKAAELGIEVISLHIEAVSQRPTEHALQLCDALGVHPDQDLFAGASLSVLNGWVDTASEADLDLLNMRLSHWIRHFRYSSTETGFQDPAVTEGKEETSSVDRASTEPA